MFTRVAAISLALLAWAGAAPAERAPVRIILDTDIGTDIDDAWGHDGLFRAEAGCLHAVLPRHLLKPMSLRMKQVWARRFALPPAVRHSAV